MKYFLGFLFSFFIFCSSYTQAQTGKYCCCEFMMDMCYTLKENQEFEFLHTMSVAIEEGKGKYHINNDTIFLMFEPMAYFNEWFSIKKILNHSNKIIITVEAIDYETKKPIRNIEMMVRPIGIIGFSNEVDLLENVAELDFQNGGNYFVVGTDEDVDSLNYSHVEFPIKEPGIYELNAQLKKDRKTSQYVMMEGMTKLLMVEKGENRYLQSIGGELTFELKKR